MRCPLPQPASWPSRQPLRGVLSSVALLACLPPLCQAPSTAAALPSSSPSTASRRWVVVCQDGWDCVSGWVVVCQGVCSGRGRQQTAVGGWMGGPSGRGWQQTAVGLRGRSRARAAPARPPGLRHGCVQHGGVLMPGLCMLRCCPSVLPSPSACRLHTRPPPAHPAHTDQAPGRGCD